LQKIYTNREERAKKGLEPLNVKEEMLYWAEDVFPYIDNRKDIIEEGDELIRKVKERKF